MVMSITSQVASEAEQRELVVRDDHYLGSVAGAVPVGDAGAVPVGVAGAALAGDLVEASVRSSSEISMLVNTNPSNSTTPRMKHKPEAALRNAVKPSKRPPTRLVRSVFASICCIVLRSAC